MKIEIKIRKKAYFFSLDALIALLLIVGVILLVPSTYVSEKAVASQLQSDVINVLSSLHLNDVNNSYVASLINSGAINETNISVLEQISKFWVEGRSEEAQNIAREMFMPLDEDDNIGLWVGNDFVYSVNKTSFSKATEVLTAKELISGIEAGHAVEGFSARALLNKNEKNIIKYFGGYVGEGNISLQIGLEEFDYIKAAYFEVASNTNFSLYINGNLAGQYGYSGDSLVPVKYNITQISFFKAGQNSIELRPSGTTNLYIAGGYIKILYKAKEVNYTYPQKYSFPGIVGIVNLYDSFYVPGQVNSMDIYLHYASNYTNYLNIGNNTVFKKNSSGEEKITISDATLKTILNYSNISLKTIPLRFGLEEIEVIIGRQGNADIVLVTDMSGSMDWKMDSEEAGVNRSCSDTQLLNQDTKRVSLAKCLDMEFIDIILNQTGNRVALSAFYGDDDTPYKGRVVYHSLSSNKTSLYGQVGTYFTQGGTCICCSTNNAYNILQSESNSSRDKYIIVMTDGIPTHTCAAAGKCDGDRDGTPNKEGLWLGWGAGCYGGLEDCAGTDCLCAMQNANWSSCRAHNILNATVHSIGFGPLSTCGNANSTLNWIATCGGGSYYASSNATLLQQIYRNLAENIINISFVAQTALVVGNVTSRLYNDSFISFNYILPAVPFGDLITVESSLLGNNTTINFTIPDNTTAVEAVVVSYSGDYWTKLITLNSQTIYNLSAFGTNYIKLGDPYHVNIPISMLSKNNSVSIEIGQSPQNSTIGSSYDKVIYTLVMPRKEGYSDILPRLEGCIWNITFEDDSFMQIKAPTNYTGTETCSLSEYDQQDATDVAVYSLLKQIDFNNNGKIDASFSQDELQVEVLKVSGIPYMWLSTAEARTWR